MKRRDYFISFIKKSLDKYIFMKKRELTYNIANNYQHWVATLNYGWWRTHDIVYGVKKRELRSNRELKSLLAN